MEIRDRIKEMTRLPAHSIAENARNWRTHPFAQQQALRGVLEQVGIAGAVIAYHSERNGGALTLIDGHLRRDTAPDVEWPVIILDVTDDEADLLLASYDPLSAMAGMDGPKLESLLEELNADSIGLRDLLDILNTQALGAAPDGDSDVSAAGNSKSVPIGLEEMEVQPFEHHDYVVLIFKNRLDWLRVLDRFGLKKQTRTLPAGHKKWGFGRVIDGAQFLDAPGDPAPLPLRYEVLSGNHRVQAAREAGLTAIDVVACLDPLPRSQRTAIQLAHNSLTGEDDSATLAQLLASIEEVEWQEYAELDDSLWELAAHLEAETRTEALESLTARESWVTLTSLFGQDSVPESAAVVIRAAIACLCALYTVSDRARWQTLEIMAAEVLAGTTESDTL